MRRVGLHFEGAPLHDQQANAAEQQPAENSLKRGISAVEVFAPGARSLVSSAADDAAQRVKQGGQYGKERSDEERAPGSLHVLVRHQRQANTADDQQAPQYLRQAQRRAQPQPLNERGQRSAEAAVEQGGEPGAQARQRLKEGDVADPDADHPAQEEEGKGRAAHADAKRVGPDAQQQGGQRQPPEIGLCPPDELGRPMAAREGDGEEYRA